MAGSPRYRDNSTPLILWICAAVCAHYLFAQGGGEVAQKHEDHSFLAQLGAEARERTRQEEQTFEVYPNEAPLDPDQAAVDPPPPPPPPPEVKKPEEKKKAEDKKKPPEAPKKPEDKAKQAPEVKKPEEKKPDEAKPPPPIDQRIAVRQHVKADQQDNPKATFIADQANHVDKETVATQTSHDQDAPDPTPGGHHSGPTQKPGDSDQNKIADSDEHKGEKDKAPGEKGTEFEVQHNARSAQSAQSANRSASGQPSAANPAEVAPAGGQQGPAAPDSDQAAASNWTFNRNAPGGAPGSAPDPAHPQSPNAQTGAHTAFLGLGQAAAPGQVNLNLSQAGLVASVGQDQLRKERENDGERRLSQHRGSWQSSSFDKWRNAIENYVTSVKPGNQTALNAAAVPFATYLNGMHNRIHPIFADSFLSSLDALPPSHPLNDKKLITSLEIILTKDGHLHKMGIVKTSGITAFDVAALDSINRAQPFGPAPSAIISPDGNVYLHWEFHRDEVFACSTMNARPFLLKAGQAPPEVQPALPGQPPVKTPEGAPGLNMNPHESSTGMKDPLPGLAPVVAPLAQGNAGHG